MLDEKARLGKAAADSAREKSLGRIKEEAEETEAVEVKIVASISEVRTRMCIDY